MTNVARTIADPRRKPPPMRQAPDAPDSRDNDRAEWVKGLWHAQDDLLRSRDRQVEENLRMLAGQQWIVWSDKRRRWVDISRFLTDDERKWRQFPTLNRLMLWYMLLKARLTENPPTMTFNPGPDRLDSMLAEVMDPVWKYHWNEIGMLDVLDQAFGWLIPGGRAYLKSRIDPTLGDSITFERDAVLQLLGPDGRPEFGDDGLEIERLVEAVPFDREGNPLAALERLESGEIVAKRIADPFSMPQGGLTVDALSPFDCRGEWGPSPWHRKRWQIHRSFHTPDAFFEAYGVEIEPDVTGAASEEVGSMFRVLYGSGLFGAAEGRQYGFGAHTQAGEYVTTYELWQPPSRRDPRMYRAPGQPGGRLITVTGNNTVIRDGPRYADFKYGSPIRCLDFVTMAGRPSGTSPQEMLNSLVRARNRLWAQRLQHATLVANPIMMIDTSTGMDPSEIKNVPGQQASGNFAGLRRDPISFARPPDIGKDVPNTIDMLTVEFDQLGNVSGSQGEPPTQDASGELVKELRANADRFVGPVLRTAVIELSRLAEDFKVLIPIVWDAEKILSVAGDDGIARTLTVLPEMFERGNIDVRPDIESMLPETRSERRQTAERFYMSGIFGDPLSVEARNIFLDVARFPHLSRLHRPGGVDRTTAEQNVGALLQGVPAMEIPVYEWYEFGVHVYVLEQFMKSPEFKKQDPVVQREMVIFRMILQQAGMVQLANSAQREALVAMSTGRSAAIAEGAIQAHGRAAGIVPETPARSAGDQVLGSRQGAGQPAA